MITYVIPCLLGLEKLVADEVKRLAGHLQLLGELLLGQAAAAAYLLQLLSKGHCLFPPFLSGNIVPYPGAMSINFKLRLHFCRKFLRNLKFTWPARP